MELLREQLAHDISCSHGPRLGSGVQGHGPEQQVGTGRRQHCFRVDADSRSRPDDQALDGGWVQNALLTPEGAPSKLRLGGDFDVHPYRAGRTPQNILSVPHALGTETLKCEPASFAS